MKILYCFFAISGLVLGGCAPKQTDNGSPGSVLSCPDDPHVTVKIKYGRTNASPNNGAEEISVHPPVINVSRIQRQEKAIIFELVPFPATYSDYEDKDVSVDGSPLASWITGTGNVANGSPEIKVCVPPPENLEPGTFKYKVDVTPEVGSLDPHVKVED